MTGSDISGGRFLVTGGAGFVGSHLVDGLLSEGARSVSVLDVTDGDGNLSEALTSGRVDVVVGDVRDASVLARVASGVDGVFHLAVMPLGACQEEPTRCIEVNVTGTLNVIMAAREAGAGRIVFSSASSVYGETDDMAGESHRLAPSNLYGVGKVTGELLLGWAGATGGPEHIALRYMNVYGPRQRSGLIPATLGRIRAGEAPVVGGDGSSVFDFVHVFDVASANVRAMCGSATGRAFNVGSGESHSVKEIVTRLIHLCGADVEAIFEGGPSGPGRVGEIDAAILGLGWHPEWSLDRGLADLVGRPS